ncbi:MAG: hypothetical protein RL217_436 [Pseudomonadota bacterium]|jgi:ubiquinone biosynthesis protein UbiJ
MLNALPLEMQQGLMLPIELALNAVLRKTPASRAALGKWQGRVLALHLGSTSIFVRVLDQSLALSLGQETEADAALSGEVRDFMQLAQASNKADSLINSQIDLSGDSEFAIALTRILDELDIDWEALISPVTGGLLAHQLGKRVRSLFKWAQHNRPLYGMMAKNYLEDELALVASANELAEFADQVDQAKLACDRLEARLAQKLANSKEP